MSEEIKLPSLGVAIQDAKVTIVKKQKGDPISKNETIIEVETDKVNFEIVSPIDGVILGVFCKVGDEISLEDTVAIVGQPGESVGVKDSLLLEDNTQKEIKDESKTVEVSEETEFKTKVKATPSAKAEASRQGIDLSKISGTGLNGLITKDDVLNVLNSESVASSGEAGEELIPFTGVRKQIAERVAKSKNENVQVTTVIEVDLTEVDVLRKILKKHVEVKEGINLTYLPFVINAVIKSIEEYPILNSSLQDEKIHVKKYVNFGVAVESNKGLIVPVVHNTEKMEFWELVRCVDDVIKKARSNSLKPQDLGNGTITISNAGSYGSIISTPIIVYPQSSIIWMGRVVDRPVYIGEEIKKRKMVYLCVSYDHRVMDGATVAQFLASVKSRLENPGSIIIG
ncbi:MAG: dihydrolipoamide succinyltransferase [Clostridiales bacterium]|nr:dihydrolipoamide succinyltransferase [Clostridiales bacterium]